MIENKIKRKIEAILYWWTQNIEGDIPLKFSNKLAMFLFANSLYKAMYQIYRKGRKDEQKKRKQKQVEKYQNRQMQT